MYPYQKNRMPQCFFFYLVVVNLFKLKKTVNYILSIMVIFDYVLL